MNKEIEFLLKIARNAAILAGLQFVTFWAVGDISWIMCKTTIIFLTVYVLTELAKRYGLDTKKAKLKSSATLIL